MCDGGYTVQFTADAVIISNKDAVPVITGWRGKTGPRLWRMTLQPAPEHVPTLPPQDTTTGSLRAYSAYNLPSVQALVRYLHAAAGFPVRNTWLRAIKAGNYASWPGLTYQNAAKYCPDADETLQGHMVQTRQGVRSTHQHPRRQRIDRPPLSTDHDAPPTVHAPTNELHIHVEHVSKLYTDDTGRFPVRSRRGNQYIMVA